MSNLSLLSAKTLGHVEIPLASLAQDSMADMTLALKGVKTGTVNLQLEYREFALKRTNTNQPDGTNAISASGSPSQGSSSAMVLFVSNLHADDLAASDCYLKLTVGSTSHKSGLQSGQSGLSWNAERFSFNVHSADVELLHIAVKQKGKVTGGGVSTVIGTVSINLRDVVKTGQLNDFFRIEQPVSKAGGTR